MKDLFKSKQVWLAISGMATAIGTYFAGELGLQGLVIAMFTGATMIANRDATRKAALGKPV